MLLHGSSRRAAAAAAALLGSKLSHSHSLEELSQLHLPPKVKEMTMRVAQALVLLICDSK